MSKKKSSQKATQKTLVHNKKKFEKALQNFKTKNQKSKKMLMKHQKSFLTGGVNI